MVIYLATRKIRINRNGGMQLTIPKSFTVNIKAERDQKLAMYLDEKNQTLIIKKVKSENGRH